MSQLNDPSVVANYRLILLLSTVEKVLQKRVHKNMFNLLRDHDVLTSLQSGVIAGDSTVKQPVYIYNTICKALDEGNSLCCFCDLSEAFDRVWHKGPIYKVKTAGIT